MTLVRSPTRIKPWLGLLAAVGIVTGSKPLSLVAGSGLAGFRGGRSFVASAMAAIWSGVVPQHPPTMFRNPLCA